MSETVGFPVIFKGFCFSFKLKPTTLLQVTVGQTVIRLEAAFKI